MKRPTPLSTLLDVTADYPADPVQLDELDRRLLALLSADARISRRQLAKALHMSPPAISERVARLERSGVIQGYAVKIGWAALGYVTVYLSVSVLPGADQGAIIESLDALPEVEDVVLIAGSLDMLARMRVRNHSHLRELLLSRVFQIDGLQKTETLICVAEAPLKTRYVADLVEPEIPRARSNPATVEAPRSRGLPA